MGTTGIRIEMPNDIHKLLSDEQKKRKELIGKTVPLASIVLEYFSIGFRSELTVLNNRIKDNGSVKNEVQSIIDKTQNEKKLEVLENNLKSLERELNFKEKELRGRERDYYEQIEDIFEKKEQLFEEKEKIRQIGLENVDNVINVKMISLECEKKDEEIKQLKEMVKYLKEQVLKALSKLDNKPDKSILIDYILPLLPTVVSAMGFYFTNKNINKNELKIPFTSELEEACKKLGINEIEKLSEMLKETITKKP